MNVQAPPSLLRNVLSNWAALAASIVYSLVLTPVVVAALGPELYGVWSFLNGLLAYTDLLYVGLGASLVKYVAESFAREDNGQVSRLTSVTLTVYLAIGVLSLAVCGLAGPFVPGILGVDPTASRSIAITCALLGVRLLGLFVSSAYGGVLVGVGRTDAAVGVRLAFTLVRLCTVPLIGRVTDPLTFLAAIVAVTALLEMALARSLAQRLVPGLRARVARPHWPELRRLYSFGLQAFFIVVATKIISYTDTTVIGLRLGARDVAFYSLPLQLTEYGRILIAGIVTVLLPHLSTLVVAGDSERLRETYLASVRLTTFIAAFVNLSIVFLGASFLERWVGRAYGQDAGAVLVLLGTASLVQAFALQPAVPFFQALDVMGWPVAVLLGEAVVNLVLSIVLAPVLGLAGVALATAVPALLISGVLLPARLARALRIPVRQLLRATLPAPLICLAAGALTYGVLNAALPNAVYAALSAKAAAGAVVAVVIGIVFLPWTDFSALTTQLAPGAAVRGAKGYEGV